MGAVIKAGVAPGSLGGRLCSFAAGLVCSLLLIIYFEHASLRESLESAFTLIHYT